MATAAALERNREWVRVTSDRMVQEAMAFGLTTPILSAGLHAAILLKEHKHFEEAGKVFRHLVVRWPDSDPLAYEHIQFLHRVGSHAEADGALMRAVGRGATDNNILRECILRGLIRTPPCEAMHGRMLEVLLSLVSTTASPYILALSTLRKAMAQTLETTRAQCLGAVRDKTPFCLLFLGDGEGAFLQAAAVHPAQVTPSNLRATTTDANTEGPRSPCR
jgi:hypothetical protein